MNLVKLAVFLPSAAVIVLDQISKYWIRSSIPLWKSYPVLGQDFFRLTHVENTGIAFGLRAGTPLFLISFSLVASTLLIYFMLKPQRLSPSGHHPSVQLALSLILGGAFGNLIDRIVFRHVTDFLDFDFPDFIMIRWPTFNIADSAVTIGVCLWALHIILDTRTKSSQTRILDTVSSGEEKV